MIKNLAALDLFLGLAPGTLETKLGSADDFEVPIPEKEAASAPVIVDAEQFDFAAENAEILPFANKLIVADVYIAKENAPQKRFNTSKSALTEFQKGQKIDANFAMLQNKSDKGRVYMIDVDATKALAGASAGKVAAKTPAGKK